MLVVRELEVTYQGAIAAVRGVSLTASDRGVVALLGANGAGKTTILRAISGLLGSQGGRIVHGTIEFDGQSITALDAPRIVRLGITQALEGRRLFGALSVDENLRAGAFAVRDAGATRHAYERVMELFPILRERRSSAAGYLSGGEQQMLTIGRALMANPRLLLLDELSLGLSPVMVQQIGKIISEISAAGTAVLLVEQNAQMALTYATHGYVLETGRVVLDQPAAELRRDERVRTFYLGLHGEEGGRGAFAALRQQRPERRWTS
ncbi:MAG TPA: ABC transporter ATP-binding protein [Ktedonobacterales bacterium]|nr:ABC transporter ATP-binding protein [Ktedonobacterales bacterium]